MPNLYGQKLTRKQVSQYTGASWQAGGIRTMQFVDGPEDGTRVVQLDTGTGLMFNVLPSRGLDIASAKFCGASLSFDTPVGEAHPAHYDPHGFGWLKTFFGGLLTTCGMTWAGAPCTDQGEELGLHGRYTNLAARNLKINDSWKGGRRTLSVTGDVRESVLFGPNLLIQRTISCEVGRNTIRLEDNVYNDGFQKTPHMVVYHFNLGFPLLSEQTRFKANSKVCPRDDEALKGFNDYDRFDAPIPGYQEQVFYHEIQADRQGYCTAALVNPSFNNGQGLGLSVRYRQKELPRFTQWKMIGAGNYVCGLEPSNCRVQGRDYEREQGTLVFLKPGESKQFVIELTVLPNNEAIEQLQLG